MSRGSCAWLIGVQAFCMLLGSVPNIARADASSPFVRIVPGSGFTTLPPATPSDTTARAIAKFDVVPYQVVRNDIYIGVVAFHMNGIAYVAFSAAGGPWVRATQPQKNP